MKNRKQETGNWKQINLPVLHFLFSIPSPFGSGKPVWVDELINAVNNILNGCVCAGEDT